MKKIIVLSLLIFSGFAVSAPIKFNFTFLENGGTAKTVGYVIYEETLLSNPGDNSFDIPDAAILDLYAVVTGTTGGDGVFTLNNFDFVFFNTGGLHLDFTRELVGQPTDGAPWGTETQAKSNDEVQNIQGESRSSFTLIASRQQPNKTAKGVVNPPPTGNSPFVLRAASGELMSIASFSAHIPIIPTLSNDSLILTALLLMLLGFYYHRKVASL